MTTPANDDINHPAPGKFKVISLYLGFLAVIALQFPMDMAIQLLSVALLAALGMVIGFCRRESEPGSLLQNHATYLSRSLWMWGFLLFLGVAGAGIYISKHATLATIQQMSQDLLAHNMNTPAVRSMLVPSAYGLVPSTAYIAVRFFTGLARAVGGYRVKNPKGFF